MQTAWETTCPVDTVLMHGAGDDTLPFLLDTLNWAIDILSDGGNAVVATRWTGDQGSTSKPLTVSRTASGMMLTVRRTGVTAFYDLGSIRPIDTSSIEPGREPPAPKTMAFACALRTQLRHVLENPIGELPEHRARLDAVEAFVRTSGRVSKEAISKVALASPWTPIRAYELTDRFVRGPSVLTRAEARAWNMPPAIMCLVSGEDQRPRVQFCPLQWNVRNHALPSDPIQDMRLIASLPRTGRR